jgi:hypothetical protein
MNPAASWNAESMHLESELCSYFLHPVTWEAASNCWTRIAYKQGVPGRILKAYFPIAHTSNPQILLLMSYLGN